VFVPLIVNAIPLDPALPYTGKRVANPLIPARTQRPENMMEPMTRTTADGTTFALLAPQDGGRAATLLLFAIADANSLPTEPYSRLGRVLHARGWNVASLDLPCHGADRRKGEPAELHGWAARVGRGEDFVAAFRRRVDAVVDHLVATNLADPSRLAATGTSRGGFMAFHAAAGNPLIRAVAALSPVTDLLALSEFAGLQDNPLVRRLALVQAADALADRAAWITIGDADGRVGTDKAVEFANALAAAGKARGLKCGITLRVLPTPGHVSFPQWHDEAAEWFTGLPFIADARTTIEESKP
jgi:dienelactone hydrolase